MTGRPRRALATVGAALAAAALTAGGAAASVRPTATTSASVQSSSSGSVVFGVSPFGSPVTSVQTIPARIAGQVAVTFQGSAAAGCASRGLCGYAGTVAWIPGQMAWLELTTGGGSSGHLVLFSTAGGPFTPGGITRALVTEAAPASSVCADAAQTGTALTLPVRRGRVAFSLGGASSGLLSSRCAGPRDGDVLPALPVPSLPLAAVRHGERTVAIDATRTFTAGGFSGTVSATLRLRLGRPGRRVKLGSGSGRRALVVGYRAALRGSITEQVSGSTDPTACSLLGSCGLTGAVTLSPATGSVPVTLVAAAPARRPLLDLRTAAGLAAGGTVKGVSVFASGSVPGGTAGAELTQGGTTCRDTTALGSSYLIATLARQRLRIGLLPARLSSGGAVTRCPGPLPAAGTEVGASVPAAALRRRVITVTLRAVRRFGDDGYTGRIVPALTVTLTRTSARARVVTGPAAGLL